MKQILSKYGLKLYIYLSIVFTPIVPTLLWLGFFVFADTFTGVWKAKKKGEAITSKAFSQTITKILLYFLAVICSQVIDTQFLAFEWLPASVTQLVAGFIAFIEFKSVIENVSEILGVPLWQYIKSKINRKTDEKGA